MLFSKPINTYTHPQPLKHTHTPNLNKHRKMLLETVAKIIK